MSADDPYKTYLWEFLNLEEHDETGLSNLVTKLSERDATEIGKDDRFFRLKLKVAARSTDPDVLAHLHIDVSELNLDAQDDYEMALLKSQLFIKFQPKLDSFVADLKDYIDKSIDDPSPNNDKKEDLLMFYNDQFVLKQNQTSDGKPRKNILTFLDGEPMEDENIAQSMIHKFKELLYNNNVYTAINAHCQLSSKDLYSKLKLLVLANCSNDGKKNMTLLLVGLVLVFFLGLKAYSHLKKIPAKLYNRIKILLKLLT